jgi:hypothetical protein
VVKIVRRLGHNERLMTFFCCNAVLPGVNAKSTVGIAFCARKKDGTEEGGK